MKVRVQDLTLPAIDWLIKKLHSDSFLAPTTDHNEAYTIIECLAVENEIKVGPASHSVYSHWASFGPGTGQYGERLHIAIFKSFIAKHCGSYADVPSDLQPKIAEVSV